MSQEQEKQGMVSIYEARHEKRVSVKDGKHEFRFARFLKPCAENVVHGVNVPNTPLLSEIFSHSSMEWPAKVISKTWARPRKNG
ncbi:conserved hypothetical protein [Ricinus communis]|uniref:Uncharacterized protein n=1 Tax=Ricinus communis TaxID=3988 RepID=B9SAF7_RICCO|nr:conserved hypothetical protein [Ricinus communis]